MTRKEKCHYVALQLYQKQKKKLLQLYALPEDQLRKVEHGQLIELSASIEWDAYNLVIRFLTQNAVKHPNAVWVQLKAAFTPLSYAYIQWKEVPDINAKDGTSLQDRLLDKWSAWQNRNVTDHARIQDAQDKNIKLLKQWCTAFRSLLEQALQDQ